MGKKNRKEKNKQFSISLSKKEIRKKTRINKGIEKRRKLGIERERKRRTASSNRQGKNAVCRLVAPSRLSISQNTEETLVFFADVIHKIEQCKYKDVLFFDLAAVELITPDAIMYLIAVIKNNRLIRGLSIECAGNLPNDATAKNVIEQSGFYSFVRPKSTVKVDKNQDYMKISAGQQDDGALAGAFCDFVQRCCKVSISETKNLYTRIIELMTNTRQHAYKGKDASSMIRNWYIFAQDMSDCVHFVFLDTGAGIPKTVAKKFRERILELMLENDAMYLRSALLGDFRSETKQGHRGKGLPGIYEDVQKKNIKNLNVISGRGVCSAEEAEIVSIGLKTPFEGTLFSWDIAK